MFNILPGSGLGFSGSQILAFGLGARGTVVEIELPTGGGGFSMGGPRRSDRDIALRKFLENLPMMQKDDEELIMLVQAIIDSGIL